MSIQVRKSVSFHSNLLLVREEKEGEIVRVLHIAMHF